MNDGTDPTGLNGSTVLPGPPALPDHISIWGELADVDHEVRHVDVAGCLRLGLGGQARNLIGREHIAERAPLPVHHQRVFGVDHQATILNSLHAPRMRLDKDEAGRHGGTKSPGGIGAERTTSGHQRHGFQCKHRTLARSGW